MSVTTKFVSNNFSKEVFIRNVDSSFGFFIGTAMILTETDVYLFYSFITCYLIDIHFYDAITSSFYTLSE